MVKYNPEIAENVLRPGNLVWGVRIDESNWGSIVREGIKPARIAQNNPRAQAEICTGLLPNAISARQRYIDTLHHGPRTESPYTPLQVAIILSRERLLAAFPGQVKAVGSLFAHHILASRYEIDSVKKTVFGIPIGKVAWPSYPDEVKICPGDKELLVDQSFWDGIIVRNYHCWLLYLDTKRSGQKLNLPVIDTATNLLTMHLP